MMMRVIAIILVLGIAALQWPMWLGKGGWFPVWELEETVEAQRITNAKLAVRNLAMAAEVRDLKTGTQAIEERARSELGMIKKDEVFFHILERHNKVAPVVPRHEVE